MIIVAVGDHYLTRFQYQAGDGIPPPSGFAALDDVPGRVRGAIEASYARNGYTGRIKFLCGGAQQEGDKTIHWVRTEVQA